MPVCLTCESNYPPTSRVKRETYLINYTWRLRSSNIWPGSVFQPLVFWCCQQQINNLIKMAIKADLKCIKWFPLMSYLIYWFSVENVHYCPLLDFELLGKFYRWYLHLKKHKHRVYISDISSVFSLPALLHLCCQLPLGYFFRTPWETSKGWGNCNQGEWQQLFLLFVLPVLRSRFFV